MQVEADKDAAIEDLQARLMAAGVEAAESSAATSSLRQQLENRAARDEQIAHALCSTEEQTQQVEDMCRRVERSSFEQVARLQAEIAVLRATLDALRADHHEQGADMQHLLARADALHREHAALRARAVADAERHRHAPTRRSGGLLRLVRNAVALGAAGVMGARIGVPASHAALTG